jgi:hypothetical protein
MSCCGQNRAAWRQQVAQRVAAAPSPPPRPLSPVAVRHLGAHPISVPGPRSGLVYLFGGPGDVLEVDGRDLQFLLDSGRVQRV